jgi:hypothetical protein
VPGITTCGFADDTKILGFVRSTQEITARFQQGHQVCIDWARRFGIKFAPAKYKILRFSRGRSWVRHRFGSETALSFQLPASEAPRSCLRPKVELEGTPHTAAEEALHPETGSRQDRRFHLRPHLPKSPNALYSSHPILHRAWSGSLAPRLFHQEADYKTRASVRQATEPVPQNGTYSVQSYAYSAARLRQRSLARPLSVSQSRIFSKPLGSIWTSEKASTCIRLSPTIPPSTAHEEQKNRR